MADDLSQRVATSTAAPRRPSLGRNAFSQLLWLLALPGANSECLYFCSGHGKCSPGADQCACFDGFVGEYCETPVVKRSCRAHCSGHGRCDERGHCLCDAGFAGAACSRAVPNACIGNCGGHGACLAGGACACDAGFGGADCSQLLSRRCPLGCSGRGLCGPSGDCVCEPGYSGAACSRVGDTNNQQPPSPPPTHVSVPAAPRPKRDAIPSRSVARYAPAFAPCPGNCSAHGHCNRGQCTCHPGFGGRACATVLSACPTNCSGHGTCDPASGTCECHPGYAGDMCDLALAVGCPMGCSAHGTCMAGMGMATGQSYAGEGGCLCRDGLAPPACAYATGSRAARVAAAVGQVLGLLPGGGGARCPLSCSGRGHCLGEVCVCTPGFTGPGCEHATPRCPADCNAHGKCVEGFCACDRGWQGVECAMPAYECDGGCGGHGTCVAVGVDRRQRRAHGGASGGAHEGTCACHAGYTGAHCETFALESAVCLHNCSGRGTCTVGGECACAPGFTGAACELVDTEQGECPKQCCGHGQCRVVGGSSKPPPLLSTAAARALGFTPGGAGGHSTRRCECDALWTGRDCCTPRRTEACPHGCSGHGICAAGRCQCEHGWSGESCAVVDAFACPRACSAHGRCRRDGTCECERGFSGAACEHGDPYGAVSTNDLLRHT